MATLRGPGRVMMESDRPWIARDYVGKPAQPKKNDEEKYVGVTYSRKARKWMAQIRLNGVMTYIGLYKQPVEAARAYNKFARKLGLKTYKVSNNKVVSKYKKKAERK